MRTAWGLGEAIIVCFIATRRQREDSNPDLLKEHKPPWVPRVSAMQRHGGRLSKVSRTPLCGCREFRQGSQFQRRGWPLGSEILPLLLEPMKKVGRKDWTLPRFKRVSKDPVDLSLIFRNSSEWLIFRQVGSLGVFMDTLCNDSCRLASVLTGVSKPGMISEKVETLYNPASISDTFHQKTLSSDYLNRWN